MALSDHLDLSPQNPGSYSFKGTTGIYAGSLVGLNTGRGATGVAGEISPYKYQDDQLLLGPATTSNIGHPLSDPDISVELRDRIETVAFTSGSALDIGKILYASDDGTYVLNSVAASGASQNIPVGVILKVRNPDTSSAEFEYLRWGLPVQSALGASAYGRKPVNALVYGGSATGTVGIVLIAPSRGRILSTRAGVRQVMSGGGSGTQTLQLQINGTNITGGVVSWAEASDSQGSELTGSAITAGTADFEAGDEITLDTTAGGGASGGLLDFQMIVQFEAGL